MDWKTIELYREIRTYAWNIELTLIRNIPDKHEAFYEQPITQFNNEVSLPANARLVPIITAANSFDLYPGSVGK